MLESLLGSRRGRPHLKHQQHSGVNLGTFAPSANLGASDAAENYPYETAACRLGTSGFQSSHRAYLVHVVSACGRASDTRTDVEKLGPKRFNLQPLINQHPDWLAFLGYTRICFQQGRDYLRPAL